MSWRLTLILASGGLRGSRVGAFAKHARGFSRSPLSLRVRGGRSLTGSLAAAAAAGGSSAEADAQAEAQAEAQAGAQAEAQAFIDGVNEEYEELHRAFETQFWGTKMALSGPGYSTAALTSTKATMEGFLASQERLDTTRRLLTEVGGALNGAQLSTLKLFERTFGCYIMESDVAKALRREATAIEGQLESARNTMTLGAELPSKGGAFEEMSSVGLRSRMRVSEEEGDRKACWEGLRTIGDFVLDNGFLELVKSRNAMAKELGYLDYYDYKVTQAEGFGKEALFGILDELERETRPLLEQARATLAADKGEAALSPWNTGYLMAGDVTAALDPYFPFEKSVLQWGRSFAALCIGYKGATMDLDLLDRKNKYSNGFCHWPQPAWRRADGSWQPSTAHFTSLADPSSVGSGLTALTTLMHEAGHAAHFANIDMPSPLFAQERAPTSVPYAELQSMLLDSLVGDAGWRATYALNRAGDPLPWALHQRSVEATHPYEVLNLRSMLAVPYFEKALYELPPSSLTAANVRALADEVEANVQGGLGPRPLLSVPHLLSDEASCYYHGYVLAEMAVHQTRAFFAARQREAAKGNGQEDEEEEEDAVVVGLWHDASVGPTLAEHMWRPGNSEAFLDLVHSLTGKPLSSSAWVSGLATPTAEKLAADQAEYNQAIAIAQKQQAEAADGHGSQSRGGGVVDLDMRVRLVDGDEVIADTAEEGGDFALACAKFEAYLTKRFPATA